MRSVKHIVKPLTSDEFRILLEVTKDPFKFSEFVSVVNPVVGKVNFSLYPYQKRVLWEFLTQRFNIVLKFRQAGLTELIAMYCLWLAMFHENKNIVIISIKEPVAKKVLRKIKFMYKSLPEFLKVDVINGRSGELGTAKDMEFANGSIISSIPTTEEAGRSEALSLLVIDEAAIVRWADTIWASALPTLSTGGQAILNSCITGDTEIITKNGPIRVDLIAPKEFGKQDISVLNLEVPTHQGRWKKVLGSVNKGRLETWEVENDRGQILKATPAHKLLTPQGWKPIKEIVDKDLNAIFYDTQESRVEENPTTERPEKEVLKKIKGFPKYRISNWGYIYFKQKGKIKKKRLLIGHKGHLRVSLSNRPEFHNKKFQVAHLVARAFLGEIPEGHVVDHINNNPNDNYVTNLQIISRKENAQRATKHNQRLNLATRIKTTGTNYQVVGYILENRHLKQVDIIRNIRKIFNLQVQPSYVTRILKGHRLKSTYISKLKVKRVFMDNIYDICVEDDESYLTRNHYINHNTPYGIGNFFHKTWVSAYAGGNGFNPIRLHWQMHPDRGIDWYNEMRNALGPRRTAQEIDGDFLTSGHSVFDLADIKAIEDTLSEYPPLDLRRAIEFNPIYKLPLPSDGLKIFKEPVKNRRFSIGSDVSTGRARDYSAFTIMDDLGEEYGCFKGKIPPNVLADLMGAVGKIYNWATLGPESNDIGLAATEKLQTDRYPNLYYSTKFLKEKGQKKPKEEKIPGWYTTLRNRPVIINELEEDVRMGNVTIKDPFFVQEAYTFIYDESNRPIAMGKDSNSSDAMFEEDTYTDDSILGKCITNHIRKTKPKALAVLPQ